MSQHTQLLMEFRASYDRLVAARDVGGEAELHHAERNFHAAAESLARLVPRLVASLPEDDLRQKPCEARTLSDAQRQMRGRP